MDKKLIDANEMPDNVITINGRSYPLWSQFVNKKSQWIGGILEDDGDVMDRALMGEKTHKTEIIDIILRENGPNSAFFEVVGKSFSCGFSTEFGGVSAGEEGWITFSGYGGHSWRIKTKDGK